MPRVAHHSTMTPPWLAVLLTGLVIWLASPWAANAQLLPVTPAEEPAEEPEPPPGEVEELLDLLADPTVRGWLRDRVGLPPEPAEPEAEEAEGGTVTAYLQNADEHIRAQVAGIAFAIEHFPAELDGALLIWSFEMSTADTLRSLGYVAIFLLVGTAFDFGFLYLFRDVKRRLTTDMPAGFGARVSRTTIRLGFNLLNVGAFALGSVGTFLLFEWNPIVRLFIITFLSGFVLWRLVDSVGVFLLAPRTPELRLIPVGDAFARVVMRYIRAAALVAIFGYLICSAFFDLGFFPSAHGLLLDMVGLAVALVFVAFVWHQRRPVADALAGGGSSSRMRQAIAELWPWLASVYILLATALWVLGAYSIFWTLQILGALVLADVAVRQVLHGGDSTAGPDGVAVEESPYLPVARRLARVVLAFAALALLAAAWGADLGTILGGTTAAGRIARTVFDVVIALLIADFIWQAVRTGIDRKLAEFQGAADAHGAVDTGGEGGGVAGPGARLKTLLPLVRNFIMIVLLVMVTLIVLSSLGVDIGPLLAGAGVVGLAIGFGAQTLVRDIVSGIFFLIDDAFRVGEYIEVGELRGTVESISIRSLRLRHHRGAVHTIPFGEIPSLTNYSRDWVIMKLEFRVPFDTDLSLVKRIVKQIGKELLNDETLGASFIEPLKSQGVRRWEEFNMVIGVKFMAKPGQQWLIRREAYQRIRDAFEAHGLNFAHRDVTVRVARDATPEEIDEAAAGAAHQAIEQRQDAPGTAAAQ